MRVEQEFGTALLLRFALMRGDFAGSGIEAMGCFVEGRVNLNDSHVSCGVDRPVIRT